MKLLPTERLRTPLMTSQHWLRWWLGAIMHQAISWINVNLVLCRLLASQRYNKLIYSLQWHHNGHDGISNHQPHDCLLNHLFRHRSKKTSKLRVTGLSQVAGEFPAQKASCTENVSIWWRHHVYSFPNHWYKDTKMSSPSWISHYWLHRRMS